MYYDDYKDLWDLSRPESGRLPMDRANRAKQFAPFAALKGFEEAVDEKAVLYDMERDLSEEELCELDRRIHEVKTGMVLTVIWFERTAEDPGKGHYRTVSGRVAFFDPRYHLRIEDTEICIRDIAGLEGPFDGVINE